MAKLNELSDFEDKDVQVDKNGDILCKECLKELAILTEYGMRRNCNKCGNIKSEAPMAIINEHGRRKIY